MAKTVSKDIFLEVASEANAPPFSITVQEGALQTFKKGWIVMIVAGYCVDCASDTPGTIYGVANEDAHNDATAGTHQISVSLANTVNVFAGNALEAALADHVLVQADIGVTMAIQRDTANNRVFLNASTKAGANCRVFTLRTGQNTDVGDTNGRLLFVFLPNFSQSLGTS